MHKNIRVCSFIVSERIFDFSSAELKKIGLFGVDFVVIYR
jgi:hypothetical protein